jgi:hypothetical protein
MRMAGQASGMGGKRGAYSVVVEKSEFKRPLGSLRNRWCDNIEMDLQDVSWGTRTGFIWLKKDTGGGLF